MPHTSRKRRPQQTSLKRTQQVGEDGWTRVTTKRSAAGLTDSNSHHVTAYPKRLDENATLETLQRSFDTKYKRLEDDAQLRRDIGKLLPLGHEAILSDDASSMADSEEFLVDQGVCLALGSLSRDDTENSHRSMWQLATFVWLCRMFAKDGAKSSVPMYAQDPMFTTLDKEFLPKLGIEVLENDKALEHIDFVTFLFCPCLEWSTETPYRSKVSREKAQVYLTSNMNWVIEEANLTKASYRQMFQEDYGQPDPPEEDDHPRMLGVNDGLASAKAIKEKYSEYRFPEQSHSNGLHSTFYFRKENDHEQYETWIEKVKARISGEQTEAGKSATQAD